MPRGVGMIGRDNGEKCEVCARVEEAERRRLGGDPRRQDIMLDFHDKANCRRCNPNPDPPFEFSAPVKRKKKADTRCDCGYCMAPPLGHSLR